MERKSEGPRASRGSVASASERHSGGMGSEWFERDTVGDDTVGDGYDVGAAR
jgi:hypothetical protein